MKPSRIVPIFILLLSFFFSFGQERGIIVIDHQSSRKITEDFIYEIELFPGEEFSGYIYHYTEEGDEAYGDLQEEPEVDWLTVSPSSFTAVGCDRPVPVKFTFRAPDKPGKYKTTVVDDNWNWQDNVITLIVTTRPDSTLGDSLIITDGSGGFYHRYQLHEYKGLNVDESWYADGYCGTNPYLVNPTRRISRAVNPEWPGITFSPQAFTLGLNEQRMVAKTFLLDGTEPDSVYEAIYSEWRSYPAYIKWKFVPADEYCLGWEQIPTLNLPSEYSGAVVWRDSICLVGGLDPFTQQPTGRVEVLREDRWGVLPAALNIPRYGFACGALGDKIFVFGGRDANGQPLNSVEYYDGQEWIISDDTLPEPLYNMAGAAYSNSFYMFGGKKDARGGYSGALWRYIPLKGWTVLHDSLPFDAREMYGCVVADRKIYLFGGMRDSISLADAYVYDIAADAFTSLEPMSVARAGFACGMTGEYIYVAGGISRESDAGSSVEFLDPSSGKWFACQDAPDLAVTSTAAISYHDHLFLLGGSISRYGNEPDYRSCYGSGLLSSVPPPAEPGIGVQAFPNPFRDRAVIHIDLPYDSHVRLALYDLRGRQVMELADGPLPAGDHDFFITGELLAEGLYFGELTTDKDRVTKKLVKVDD